MLDGQRSYTEIMYLLSQQLQIHYLTFIEFIMCAEATPRRDKIVSLLIDELPRLFFRKADLNAMMGCLNSLRSQQYHHWCSNIIAVVCSNKCVDGVIVSLLDFDVCVKLLSHSSTMTPRFRVYSYNADSLTSLIIYYYQRRTVGYMKEYEQFYSSVVMHIYAGDIWEIFKHWVKYWKFRKSYHALVLYICEHMTINIMRQINHHIDDFVHMLHHYIPNRHDLVTIQIFRLLIMHGLDIFRKCPTGCLYDYMVHQDSGLYDIAANFCPR